VYTIYRVTSYICDCWLCYIILLCIVGLVFPSVRLGRWWSSLSGSGPRNLWCSVTDHLPNYIIIQTDKTMKNELPWPLIRLHSPRKVQTFQSTVSSIDWSDLYYVNEAFSKLVTRLNKCYEDSFPLSRKCAHDKNG